MNNNQLLAQSEAIKGEVCDKAQPMEMGPSQISGGGQMHNEPLPDGHRSIAQLRSSVEPSLAQEPGRGTHLSYELGTRSSGGPAGREDGRTSEAETAMAAYAAAPGSGPAPLHGSVSGANMYAGMGGMLGPSGGHMGVGGGSGQSCMGNAAVLHSMMSAGLLQGPNAIQTLQQYQHFQAMQQQMQAGLQAAQGPMPPPAHYLMLQHLLASGGAVGGSGNSPGSGAGPMHMTGGIMGPGLSGLAGLASLGGMAGLLGGGMPPVANPGFPASAAFQHSMALYQALLGGGAAPNPALMQHLGLNPGLPPSAFGPGMPLHSGIPHSGPLPEHLQVCTQLAPT